jgi:hypothetical protein
LAVARVAACRVDELGRPGVVHDLADGVDDKRREYRYIS